MADLSIFKLDSQTITIKDTTARQAAESAKTLATIASGNATTALNKINELESEKADAIISSASGAIASFPDGADGIPLKSCIVQIGPVQAGSGDPSPDNVRPISGWTGAKVTRTGKNLIDIPDKTITKEGYIFNDSFDFPPGQYVLSYYSTTPKNIGAISVVGKDDVNCSVSLARDNSRIVATINAPKRIKNIRVFNGPATYTNIQLELGSTATDYEPYQGETYDITFPSESGTVYGGSLDVTTGVLTVDRAQIASYNGETLPGKWISDRNVYAAGASPTTGAQVVYELATPITYQLTPLEVNTLLGQNNIWADTGDMSVTYRADTKLYIDNKIAELQALVLEN